MGDYLHRVEAILLLDSEGQRIFCKYYMPGYESRAKQKAFEDKLYRKVSGRVCARQVAACIYVLYCC